MRLPSPLMLSSALMNSATRGSSVAAISRPTFNSARCVPFGCIALLRRCHRRFDDPVLVRVARELVDASLDLRPEMTDEALDRPGGGITERADGVAFDLGRDLQ